MPLRVSETSELSSLSGVSEKYLIFYSSLTDGILWCPVHIIDYRANCTDMRFIKDCRRVDPTVQQIFGPNGPEALIVYVGQRMEYKAHFVSWSLV
jgi:hypothetical protein